MAKKFIVYNLPDPPDAFINDEAVIALQHGSITNALVADNDSIQSGAYKKGAKGWKLNPDGTIEATNAEISGEITATTGAIGGWIVAATTLADNATVADAKILIDSGNTLIRVGPTSGNYITIDGANQKVESSNYVSGMAGAGFTLTPDLLEVGKILARGMIRTAVFQKDIISSIGGSMMVLISDMLNEDMTAADAQDVKIHEDSGWAVGDVLRIKDDTNDEWFQITGIAGAPDYDVDRDKKGDYGAGANPAWRKGATVVNYGQSGDGGIFMTASESNAPYLSVFTHAGNPWTTINTRLRIGNLNGYLGYTTDKYGIGIGDTNNYIKYDPTNGIRIACNVANALTIEHGSDILLVDGGDVKFTSVTKPTALTAALIEIAGNVDVGDHYYKVTYVNAKGETSLGSSSNTVTNDATHKQNALTSIPISPSKSVTSRKIYRTKAGGGYQYLLTTIADNTTTTYTDDTADASLGIDNALYRTDDTSGKIYLDGYICGNFDGNNLLLGTKAGDDITIAYNDVLVGRYAGRYITTGSFNTCIGESAGIALSTGDYNTYLGANSGPEDKYNKATGDGNVCIGNGSGYNLRAGHENVAIGNYSLTFATSGYENVAIGHYALRNVISGYDNVAIGFRSLCFNSDLVHGNIAIGRKAGQDASGNNSVFLGQYAGCDETGSDKLFIDNADRSSEANGRIKALIYGIFNAVVADQTLRFNASVGINTIDFGSGKVVLAIANASTVPSANPAGGGVIYCEGGALKYRGSSGTITILGAA